MPVHIAVALPCALPLPQHVIVPSPDKAVCGYYRGNSVPSAIKKNQVNVSMARNGFLGGSTPSHLLIFARVGTGCSAFNKA
jgi:hypothetical protein